MKPVFVLLFIFTLLLSSFTWAQPSHELILEKLPEFINSSYPEITPVLSRDGRTLFFTRVAYPEFCRYLFLDSIDLHEKFPPERYERILRNIYSELEKKPITNPVNSSFNQDVWIAEADTSFSFYFLQHPGPPLNNALPNSIACITPDPNAFYCINQFSPKGDMMRGFSIIRRADSLWHFPEPVDIAEYYTLTSEVNLTMSFDGKVLILSATRHDSRDMDLYVCFKEGTNKWSAPRNLGPTVNSRYRETTPFLAEDNRTLFFSSNRWESMGGNDIFMSRRLDDSWQKWTEPQRVVEPINSRADDSQPYFNMTSGYLYFTSTRDGSSDIFRVRIAPPQPTELTLQGRILHRKTYQPVLGARLRYNAEGNPSNVIIASDGFFSLKIPRGVSFMLTPEKTGLVGAPTLVHFPWDHYYFRASQWIDLWLDSLEVGGKIELAPIYFKQSLPIILESSYNELERLSDLLHNNPTLAIRIEGHTDNVGRPEDLQQLSEQRAQAIRDFLVSRGIAAERIETVGFGARYPVNDNSTEELRAQNRRVEIRIIRM
ncbi:MAG: OmpA family protein [Saprospiraceae bacterium]|nr:OmpA family protein [Saprospiraceae bacterium]MDW8483530.1 OmpA family protein [Saprospiraceae bacterium]